MLSSLNVESILPELSIQETKELRDKLSKNIKSMRKTNRLSLTVFVEAEYRESFEKAKRWARQKKLTKTDSNWAFSKFAITNTIKMIMEEIDREREAADEESETPDTTQGPNIA